MRDAIALGTRDSWTFASKEARDGAVSTGMTDGMEYSYVRLDDAFKVAA